MNNLSEYFNSRNLYHVFLHVVLVALALQVFVLSRQNKQLKNAYSAVAESIKVGDQFSPSDILPSNGTGEVDSTAQVKVFFVFTTHCPFCTETLSVWDQIVRRFKDPNQPAFIGICLDNAEATRAYIHEHQPMFPVFLSRDRQSFTKAHKLNGVPQTIVTSISGRVLRVWNGRLAQEKLDEVVKAILDSATIQNP
jgi:peroxiredoxin